MEFGAAIALVGVLLPQPGPQPAAAGAAAGRRAAVSATLH